MLPNETRFHINDVLYSRKSKRNLSLKDILKNEYHVETMNEGNVEYFYITLLFLKKNF